MRKILVVIGTDSEAIRAVPLIHCLCAIPSIQTVVCVAAQDSQLLASELENFGFLVDVNLELIRQTGNPDLVAPGVDRVIGKHMPDFVLVYGDASRSMASFSRHASFGNQGSGLRMYEMHYHGEESAAPRMIDLAATRYFVSSETSRADLLMAGVSPEKIFITDSTEVDALLMVAERIRNDDALNTKLAADLPFLDPDKRLILVTGYRSENAVGHLESLCRALKRLAVRPDVQVVFLVHPDSMVNEVMGEISAELTNIEIIQPQGYLHSIYLMQAAYFIVAEPGDTPKEALSLCKPVLEMPDMFERPDAEAINPEGRDGGRILQECTMLLDNPAYYRAFSTLCNPYGGRHASQRIVETLLR
jgi:UDP-N-acetylglucosamine 2-epimerase (non-hydrolysing)